MEYKEPFLKVEHVTKAFGGIKATDDVSFSLEDGQSLVLIGPNGAGKTTLFNLIAGEISLDSGSIHIGGVDVSKSSVQERSHLRMARTYQICNLFKELTVTENLFLAMQNSQFQEHFGFWETFRNWKSHKVRLERVDWALEQVQLTELRNTKVKNMSHGEQRQLELGMALAPDPKLILFDEPMAGLSPTERVFIGDLIKRLVKEKMLIVIEHDINFALSITDRVAVLNHGQLVTIGTPEEIRNSAEIQKIYKL